jgi:branched-chain amino acid transport system substrate-binding protein
MRKVFSAAMAAAIVLAAPLARAADGPIRIGVLNDQSGLYSEFGGIGSVEAAKMAAADFGGTVLGRKIEILSADHQNKTDNALSITRKWFDVDGVHAIADITNSAIALAVQDLARNRGRITLAIGPGVRRLTMEECSPTGFHWAWDTYSQANGTARALIQEGAKTWFLLAADYAFGHQMAADITKTINETGGKVGFCCKVRFLEVESKSGPKDFKGLQMPTSSKN